MPRRSLLWPDPRVKPPFGVAEIDWGHPLANALSLGFLFNEGGGNIADIVTGRTFIKQSTSADWQAANEGVSVKFNANAAEGFLLSGGAPQNGTFTRLARIFLTTRTAAQVLSSWDANNGDPEWYYNSGSNTWRLDKSGVALIGTSTAQLTSPEMYTAGVSFNTGTGAFRFYTDGLLDGSGTTAASFTASNKYVIGRASSTVRPANFNIFRCFEWARVLTDSEVQWVSAEPYAMLRPIVRRRYFVPAAAGAAVTYPQLERGIRGLERGLATGMRNN